MASISETFRNFIEQIKNKFTILKDIRQDLFEIFFTKFKEIKKPKEIKANSKLSKISQSSEIYFASAEFSGNTSQNIQEHNLIKKSETTPEKVSGEFEFPKSQNCHSKYQLNPDFFSSKSNFKKSNWSYRFSNESLKTNSMYLLSCNKIFDSKKWNLNCFNQGPLLGEGAFGKVFLAQEKKSGFFVALKILSKLKLKQNKMQKHVLREIEIMSRLDHVNIVRLYGYFWDETDIYLILEYVANNDLFDLLDKNPLGLSQASALIIMRQVLDVYVHLHSKSIIHRDLKPENILMEKQIIKLTDFGGAVWAKSGKRKSTVGTLEYFSPEQLEKREYDHKVDLWQIGVLCFELLAGKSPFYSEKCSEVKSNILACKFRFPTNFSVEAKDFIGNLMVFKPEDRMTLEQCISHPFIFQF